MGRAYFYRQRWLPVLLAGAALAAPLAPAKAVGTYELPPGDSTQAKPQGPVDAGAPPPKVATPAPKPTPKPSPSAPAPVIVVPTPAPTAAAPRATASPAPAPRATLSAGAPSAAPATQASATPSPVPQTAIPAPAPTVQQSLPTAPAPIPTAPAPAAGPAWWAWAAGGAALLAILGGLAALVLRRRSRQGEDEAELAPVAIQRPMVAQAPVPQATPPARQPAPQPAPAAPPPPPPPVRKPGTLSMAVEARALTISLSAATLAYRITLTNNGPAPLGGVAIAGDMVSAHASLALTDQLATADSPLAPQHEIASIAPGESVQVTGELRLPFQAMHPIRKGKAALLVPLARLRVQAAEGGNGALMRTALVGQRAATPGAGLQPFRLDLGPRIYREVTQKIFS
ncbi:MAG: hypothetical protein J7496_03700 [Novosphingobium sp.]|nr:hypothetical protein [Novosphingobium sp.]MBO9601597.1 hypothetical protein [Novosphingobium sp.]